MSTEIQALIGVFLVLAGAARSSRPVRRRGRRTAGSRGRMRSDWRRLWRVVSGSECRMRRPPAGGTARLWSLAAPLGANLGSMISVLAAGELKEWILSKNSQATYEMAFLTIIVPLLLAAIGFLYQRPKSLRLSHQ